MPKQPKYWCQIHGVLDEDDCDITDDSVHVPYGEQSVRMEQSLIECGYCGRDAEIYKGQDEVYSNE